MASVTSLRQGKVPLSARAAGVARAARSVDTVSTGPARRPARFVGDPGIVPLTAPRPAGHVPTSAGYLLKPQPSVPQNGLLFHTDSYKHSHAVSYPDGFEGLYFHELTRPGAASDDVVFVGLQYILINYFESMRLSPEELEEDGGALDEHFGGPGVFNRELWRYVIEHHNGRLPLLIKALPEGTLVPNNVPFVTVESTDPKCPWPPGYVEGLIQHLWSWVTVATYSRKCKQEIGSMLGVTSGALAGLTLKLHDFGLRGSPCPEAAAVLGAAHLVNFNASDNLLAFRLIRQAYFERLPSLSAAATEHSIMTAYGPDGQMNAVRRLMLVHPDRIQAVVIDSFDDQKFIDDVIRELHDEVTQRPHSAPLVLRPDSGDPVDACLGTVEQLLEGFAADAVTTPTGYRELPGYVRVLQGDGVDLAMIRKICREAERRGLSVNSFSFGSGGGLLQKHNRDEEKCAYKASEITLFGEAMGIHKAPRNDPSKASHAGRVKVIRNSEGTLQRVSPDHPGEDLLQPVYNSEAGILRYVTWKEIRERAALGDEWDSVYLSSSSTSSSSSSSFRAA